MSNIIRSPQMYTMIKTIIGTVSFNARVEPIVERNPHRPRGNMHIPSRMDPEGLNQTPDFLAVRGFKSNVQTKHT